MENVNFVARKFLASGSRVITLLVFCSILLSACYSGAQETKNPNVSGSFYPADPKVLSDKIDSYLKDAIVPGVNGKIIGLISPHAGYEYSAAIAAHGYKLIQGKNYNTVVVMAPSHYYGFNGISIWPEGEFKTPLGDMKVDSEFTGQILKRLDRAKFIPEAFAKEHSLEVQLPFVQKVLPTAKIVPIVMGSPNLADSESLAGVLRDIIGKREDVLIIASTDLSHYHPYAEANSIDKTTVGYFQGLDCKGLWQADLAGKAELCGIAPVITLLTYAKDVQAKIKILKRANSGDVLGDLSKVVGYASAVIYREDDPKGETMLSNEQKKTLLTIARESMENYVKTGKRKEFAVDDPVLKRHQGAFVTLNKNGQLRGCIGRIVADDPLYEVVASMAIEAAIDDPRFYPVTAKELNDIEIDISALSPIEEIKDVNKIEVGKHGIIIRRGFFQGLLLPQVATEYGWNRETFLKQTCLKAGLPEDAWKDKTTQISIFSAEVFSEKTIK
ncbi:MAG TPA: AmmeMemoRadiSam system protein B [Candidatus Omnitrophota bacterium]|nr:AmmeMemoRadiSam system protein B [Candidatus Omnitrophota bacterium]